MEKKRYTAILPISIIDKLKAKGAETRRSANFILNDILEEYFEAEAKKPSKKL